MLSLAKLAAAGQRYYLEQADGRVDHAGSVASGVEDYYLGGPEASGRWTGGLAERLGLAGRVVEAEALHRASSWRDPVTGVQLAGPIRQARVPGFDLMFSVPKSASVVFGIGDGSLQAAVLGTQREAVAEALAYLESTACRGRLGAGGQGGWFEGGGFLAAAFEHRTSRAGDPKLHTHVLVANMIRRPDGLWAALDGRLLYAEAKTAGYIHEAAFRRALTRELGVEWRRPVNGIAEIAGVDEVVLRAFSRRRQEIEAYTRERGQSSAAARQVAAMRTRERKDYAVTPAELAPEWRARAAALGLTRERVAELRVGARTRSLSAPEREALFDALAGADGLTGERAHFDRRDVIRAIAEHARRGASRDQVEALADRFLACDCVIALATPGETWAPVIRLDDGRAVRALGQPPRYSTPAMLAIEQRVIEGALRRRDAGAGLATQEALRRALEARPRLGADQREMVRRLCGEGDGVQVVVGPAGTGKSVALGAAREAWQASGVAVVGAAVARRAARELHDSAGIDATSVAALLADLRSGRGDALAPSAVLVIDEAGMLGTRALAELLDHADGAGAKVVLCGDHRQLPEIEAGGAFRGLAVRLGAIELVENRRQQHEHDRRKLEHLRAGRTEEALTIAREHGELVLADSADQLYDRLVADYLSAYTGGANAVMIAARRSEVRELNAIARVQLDAHGRLGVDRLRLPGGEFAAGDEVVIRRNDRQAGVHNGDRGRVIAVDVERHRLEVELRGRGSVALPASFLEGRTRRGEPALAHGYALTAHVAQGMTTDRAFVLGSDAAYQEWAYTALSRASEQTRFYVCEPTTRSEEPHGSARQPDALDAVEAALQRSRAQLMAHDLAHADQVASLPPAELAAEADRLARTLAPRFAHEHQLATLESELEHAQRATAEATARRHEAERQRRGLLRRPDRVAIARHRTHERFALDSAARLTEELHEHRATAPGLGARLDEAEQLAHYAAVRDELDRRDRGLAGAARHARPAAYIAHTLGERPEIARERGAWDRAAHHVERYRASHAVTDPHRPLGPRPHELGARRDWQLAHRELQRAQRLLDREPQLTLTREHDMGRGLA